MMEGKHMMSYPKDEKSRKFIGHKIKKLLKEGRSKAQSVAIALSMARKHKA
mgnify:CR=1 FL=1